MMAVFMINICKFNGCGITFQSLGDLIQHIEDTHIDYDPRVVEKHEQQHPPCLPLSYVLRFFTDAARKESPDIKPKIKALLHHGNSQTIVGSGHILNSKAPSSTSSNNTASNRSSSPAGSEADDDEGMSASEDSNDSWTTPEEFSSEFILRYGSRSQNNNQNPEKPFACPVPGCKKRYKNVNGIKYHSKNGHKNDGKPLLCRMRKAYKCHCGKSYKNAQGLKVHTSVHHSGATLTTLTTQAGEVLQIPTRDVAAALHPVRTVTLKPLVTANGLGVNMNSISNAIGLPVKALQSVVVSAKTVDGATAQLKGSVIDASSFNLAAALAAKSVTGNSVQTTTTTNGLQQQKSAGLFINTLNLASHVTSVAESTQSSNAVISVPASSGLGTCLLTPASSPQTPPPTPEGPNSKVMVSLSSTPTTITLQCAPGNLPLTPSPTSSPPISLAVAPQV